MARLTIITQITNTRSHTPTCGYGDGDDDGDDNGDGGGDGSKSTYSQVHRHTY
jgi:hypothetical protein